MFWIIAVSYLWIYTQLTAFKKEEFVCKLAKTIQEDQPIERKRFRVHMRFRGRKNIQKTQSTPSQNRRGLYMTWGGI
jgi:hypothetical protein